MQSTARWGLPAALPAVCPNYGTLANAIRPARSVISAILASVVRVVALVAPLPIIRIGGALIGIKIVEDGSKAGRKAGFFRLEVTPALTT